MKPTGFTLFLVAFLASSPVLATEVYHWVDENGVAHYSQHAPATDRAGPNISLQAAWSKPELIPVFWRL
jgi:hypothetical protein